MRLKRIQRRRAFCPPFIMMVMMMVVMVLVVVVTVVMMVMVVVMAVAYTYVLGTFLNTLQSS